MTTDKKYAIGSWLFFGAWMTYAAIMVVWTVVSER